MTRLEHAPPVTTIRPARLADGLIADSVVDIRFNGRDIQDAV
jgi:hypothetical protein